MALSIFCLFLIPIISHCTVTIHHKPDHSSVGDRTDMPLSSKNRCPVFLGRQTKRTRIPAKGLSCTTGADDCHLWNNCSHRDKLVCVYSTTLEHCKMLDQICHYALTPAGSVLSYVSGYSKCNHNGYKASILLTQDRQFVRTTDPQFSPNTRSRRQPRSLNTPTGFNASVKKLTTGSNSIVSDYTTTHHMSTKTKDNRLHSARPTQSCPPCIDPHSFKHYINSLQESTTLKLENELAACRSEIIRLKAVSTLDSPALFRKSLIPGKDLPLVCPDICVSSNISPISLSELSATEKYWKLRFG